MVKLTKIYTRTGDDGTTGLVDGSRIEKASARIIAIGDVDEANSAIGIARTVLLQPSLEAILQRIQNDLFDLGADLATPLPKKGEPDSEYALRIIALQVSRLEQEIDALNSDMKPLDSFVLPGGSAPAAHLHLARAITRRAERSASAMGKTASPHALSYLNRLSDLLFVAARWCNHHGQSDVKWVPGLTRQP